MDVIVSVVLSVVAVGAIVIWLKHKKAAKAAAAKAAATATPAPTTTTPAA